MNHYLIGVCGHEGIVHIIGLMDKDAAIIKMKSLREKPHDEWTKPEQYCVMRVDEDSAECVCQDLGVGIEGVWLL